jgi:hypothetical protein
MPVAGITVSDFSLRPRQCLGTSRLEQVPVKLDHKNTRGFIVHGPQAGQ